MKDLSKFRDFDSIKIYLASSEEILDWSYGEVTKPETINYRTYKAERNGLFDERIFGPVKNFQCYCGKYKGIRYKNVICDKCGVEVIHSRVRRERMGHIKLASPIAHVWFFRGIPSKMALILGLTPRSVESVIYFSSFIVTEYDASKKADIITTVSKDLEVEKTHLNKAMEAEIKAVEDELKALSKEDELKASEQKLKIEQRIQKIRAEYEKQAEEVTQTFTLILKKVEGTELHSVITENEYLSFGHYLEKFCSLDIGAEGILKVLNSVDLNEVSAQIREEIEGSKGQKAIKLAKRLRVIEQFRRANLEPSRMVMDIIPVIPPELRPMVQLDGGRFATSDLNDLYRRLINRNNRLARLLDLGAPEIIVRNEKRMLQESVDALFDSSKQRKKARVSRGKKQLRSLTDMLKGKQGIFRLNLLGKRVDYSGRAVIVNGPKLALNECGVPKEMALELFRPMVLREIMARGYAPNVKSAKHYLDQKSSEVWEILEEVVTGHPVLLNRAPTLWRLGIQAFYPKLIEGNSIRLHLCVCSGFNADFDGDQMAIHVPLSEASKQEARELMMSNLNLRDPANGSPKSIPAKTMLFGTYYLTTLDATLPEYKSTFADEEELLFAYGTGALALQQKVQVRIAGEVIETTAGRVIFNQIVPTAFGYINEPMGKGGIKDLLAKAFATQENDVVVKLIDDLKDLGLKYGTLCGQSISLSDITIPELRETAINEGRGLVEQATKNFRRGLTTEQELARSVEQVWTKVISDITDAVWAELDDANPLKVLIDSGSTRASKDILRQIGGLKGIVSSVSGKSAQMPIFGNLKEGLSGLEYFIGARGARKSLIDKGLKTADAGYLTRRLVDVSQDMLIREEDCGTESGRVITLSEKTALSSVADRIVGRYLSQDVTVNGKKLAKKNDLITSELAKTLTESKGVEKVILRSPMSCETRRGVCVKCYGHDLMTGRPIRLGAAVGIQAAQSIGEPSAQLTLNVFHGGGVAGKDITQGLPRVEEVVEARTPKSLSIMSEIDGKVLISHEGDERKVAIIASDSDAEVKSMEYMIDPLDELLVEDGAQVVRGQKITAGHLDLSELFSIVGAEKTKKYILEEILKVYASQGALINDKHIEVIINKMFNHVVIEEFGDTDFMLGELATKASFAEENEKVLAEGGQPATAKLTLLGITKAALNTDSFLSAASFIQTSNVLTDAAASGRVDSLFGLKENVILGRKIPTEKDFLEEELVVEDSLESAE